MPAGEFSASVLIRSYNEELHIGRLLEGVLSQRPRPREVILVDSGSTDATLAVARGFSARILRLAPEQFSFGRALNVGCRAATGEIVVLASAHVYPTEAHWLERLIQPFDDPKVALVYGKQRGNTTTRYSEHQIFARLFPDDARLRPEPPFCNNANTAIRRSVWENLPYDEELTGLEDIDWARRAMAAGRAIVYAPDAPVIHVHQESARRIYRRYFREALAWQHIFPQSRFLVQDFLRATVDHIGSDLRQARREGVALRQSLSIAVFRTMQYWGTYQGMQGRAIGPAERRTLYYYPPLKQHEEPKREATGDAGRDS